MNAMNVVNAAVEQSLLSKLRTLSAQQVAEVEDFVEFLAAKSKKRAALDRLLAIAPALAAAEATTGAALMSEEAVSTLVQAEIEAARSERRARLGTHSATSSSEPSTAKGSSADRS